LIVDTPRFVVGAMRLTVPALPPSAETIVKTNPSRVCESGELNTTDALLVPLEIVPLIDPMNEIEPPAEPGVVSETVRTKLSTTGVVDADVLAAVNVPRLMLAWNPTGGKTN
jgi:hypothetical protein